MSNESEKHQHSDDITIKRAVALKYEMERDNAPKVIAKGEKLLAEKIISIAKEHGIYIYEDPILVSLLARVNIGNEIPEKLYRVIAEILAFVFTLEKRV